MLRICLILNYHYNIDNDDYFNLKSAEFLIYLLTIKNQCLLYFQFSDSYYWIEKIKTLLAMISTLFIKLKLKYMMNSFGVHQLNMDKIVIKLPFQMSL